MENGMEWKNGNGKRNGKRAMEKNGMERAMELVLNEATADQQRKWNSSSVQRDN